MLPEGNLLPNLTTVATKPGKKRRRPFENAKAKKPNYPEVENTLEIVEGLLENPSSCSRMILRSSQKHDNSISNDSNFEDEIEGPGMHLRRPSKLKDAKAKLKPSCERRSRNKKEKKTPTNGDATVKDKEYPCDIEGCPMGFCTKRELMLHKRNICSVSGCGKKLFSHKYLVQHHRVHVDYRPLKCPWKGCKKTFKWAWARTEHTRVHTGERPYVCREPGCGQTFRFVSDFSRHKRKTGHSVKVKT